MKTAMQALRAAAGLVLLSGAPLPALPAQEPAPDACPGTDDYYRPRGREIAIMGGVLVLSFSL